MNKFDEIYLTILESLIDNQTETFKGSSPLIKRNMSKRLRRKGPFGAKKKSKKKIKRLQSFQ